MAEVSNVTHVCKRTVVSTKPVQPGKSHQLSVLDRLVDPNRHVMALYYYQTDWSKTPVGELTKKLKEGLAEVLTNFPAVTGRLVPADGEGSSHGDEWMVKFNDAGVRMVEARAKGSVEDWLKNVDWEKEKRLIHWEEMYHKPYFWSTFYVQLTEFEEGGMAIGLSCSHLLADSKCATVLVKAWADVTLSGKMTGPPLRHRLPTHRLGTRDTSMDPLNDLCSHHRTSSTQSTPSNKPILFKTVQGHMHKTVSLSFSHEMVSSCMSSVQANSGETSPSPFEAVAGFIWAAVSRAKGLINGLVGLTMGLDMRKPLGLDDGFFGNCTVYSHVRPKHGENGFPAAAEAIRGNIAKFDKQKVMDFIEWLEHGDGIEQTRQMLAYSELFCMNLESIESQWTVFEDGIHPIRASLNVEPACDNGQFLVHTSASRDDGPLSRVVTITLPRDEMDTLIKDGSIFRFAPTLLQVGSN